MMRIRMIRWFLPLMGVAALGAGAAMAASAATHTSASGTVKLAKSAKYGMVLVSSTGRTLYRYTPDSKGKSTCSGSCASYWPAYVLKGTAKPTTGSGASSSLLGTIKRGKSLQVTYAGYPLYLYVGDTKAGAITGEGTDKTWYVVNTKGALVKKAVAASSAPGTTTTSGGSTWG
jgi:predicted lipoprotein with Yx(FWY)xxD motif